MEETKLLENPSVENTSVTDISSFVNDREHLDHGGELLERLDSEELTELRKYFYEKKVDDKVKEPKGSAHPRFCGSKLTKQEFTSAIEQILGTQAYESAVNKLLDHIGEQNAEEHKGFVWWEQILDAIIEYTVDQNKVRPWNIIKESFCSLFTLPHCKRETIVRVVPVETPTSFCYVVVSKYGRVGIYDWSMRLLEQYEVRLGAQSVTQGEGRRTTWVTDAVYLPDASMLLVAASDRSLHIYSSTGLVHVPTYHISGLPNTPTCLDYSVGATTEDPSMLLVGDDHGSITTMSFHQPQYALFKRTSTDKMDTYFWKELESQSDWVSISCETAVHKDEVVRVQYFSDNNTVVSCSNDPTTTLIIRYLAGRRAPYVFKLSRGVRCFHLDRSLKLLVTGSKDSILRMWNPVITKKPIASLFGHKSCIVDVRILKHLMVILSMSKDAAVKVWDLEEQCCLQSLPMLFPVYGALARTAEFGAQVFYPGPVSCAPPPATVQRGRLTRATPGQPQTHPASLLSDTSTSRQDRASQFNNENTAGTPSWHSLPLDNVTTAESEIIPETEELTSNPEDTLSPCLEGEWSRMEVVAACCNYVAVLQLAGRDLGSGERARVGQPLPAPHHEQDPAVPSPWLTADSAHLSTLNVDYPSQSLVSSSSAATSPIPPSVLEVIQKSLGDEVSYQFQQLTSACHNLNAAKARQYTNQKHVKVMVEQCAPHLALSLAPLQEIKFAQPLPTTTRMRALDLSQPDKLLKAKLKRDSTSTVGSKASNTSTTTSTRSARKP